MTPGWDAVGWVVTQNMRDVVERRYGWLPEIVSWFKSLSMFRETERERLILNEPTAEDLSFHKAVLALLIAEGERLHTSFDQNATQPGNEGGITSADFTAALKHLYDTQAVWQDEMTPERRAEILDGIFHGEKSGT